MHRVHRAGARAGGRGRVQDRHRLTEAGFLAFEIPCRRIDSDRRQQRVAGRLRPVGDADTNNEEDRHRRQDGPSLAQVADHAAKSKHRGRRNQQQGPDLEKIGPGVRVLERMGGVGVEEAAPVGAELLDDLLARDRPDRDGLLRALERGCVDGTGQRLRHAESDEDERADDRDRQEDVKRNPRQVDPEVPDRRRRRAREAAHEGERHREARRRRQEVVHGEAEHLGEMTHGRLAAVVLPVRIGDEAGRGVEGEIGRDGVEAARVQRQKVLQPLQGVEREESGDGKDDHRNRVGKPVLLTRRVDSRQPIEAALDRSEHRRQEVSFAGVGARDDSAQGNGADDHERKRQRDLQPTDKGHWKILEIRISRDEARCRADRGRARRPRSVRRSVRSSLASSKPPQAHGVGSHQSDDREPERYEHDIRHEALREERRRLSRRHVRFPYGFVTAGIRIP